jgi:4-hydroxy-2-oxoheptanedioate aldolase
VGGGRKSYGRTEWYADANDSSIVVVMIEDIEAVENLADILTVPQIDAFFVAHYDLAQSMGFLHDPRNKVVEEAYDEAVRQIAAAGRVVAAAVGENDLERYLSMGVSCIKAPQWRGWIEQGARSYVGKIRGT